ncbi:MAG: ABC transporter ATP-binding protein [Asgard group archaeon]|nr:ABC transporter ATP-binding protein [Asgard group archaeon]
MSILKYSKPYLLMIFLSIGILFGQANLDLALPDYLSDIVDTGIQQEGVEFAVPIAIRQIELNRTFIFMNAENQSYILKNYAPVDENSSNYDEYVESYPILENESIYVLNKVKRSVLKEMDKWMVAPYVTVFTLEQIFANPENATFILEYLGFNVTTLPPESVFFDYLSTLPAENLTLISSFITGYYDVLGEIMLQQVSILAVRLEYDIVGVDTDKIQRNFILRTGGLMLLMTLLSVLCTIAVGFLASRTAAGMARNIRYDLFEKVENFSSNEFDTFSTASLITRSTNDITQIQLVIFMIIRMVFYAPILGVGGIIRALNKNTSMWWLIGVAVLVLLVLILVVLLIAIPKFTKMQKLTDRINLIARENLIGMLVIRAFNRVKYEEMRFDKANNDLTSVVLFLNRLMVIMMPFMMLILNGLTLSIIWVGAHQVDEGFMQVGDMMAFMQYAMQIVFAFLMLTMMFIILPRAVVSAKRVNEVLKTEAIIKDPENPKTFPESFKGSIEFRNVSFKYPGAKKYILQGISFTAKPGQMTGIIGATGSGKSTIINLIPRFYDVTSGSIRIDGMNIKDVTQHDLRDKIGYVPQKSSLFSGTIESNLLFADENATDEAIQFALDVAQATEFVNAKPDGLASEVAQGGMNVSGGQKQRLTIARAMVKKPPIYIFDDIVTNLDFKTDAALRKDLKEKTSDSTVLMVTQRVSTIKDAEQILVIDDGKIVSKGTHDELMESSDIYKEIAISQLELEGF